MQRIRSLRHSLLHLSFCIYDFTFISFIKSFKCLYEPPSSVLWILFNPRHTNYIAWYLQYITRAVRRQRVGLPV